MKTQFFLAALFACTLLLATGAITYQPAAPPPAPRAGHSFVQSAPINTEAPGLTPDDLLRRAAEALGPATTPWLRCQIWQKQVNDTTSFEADGRLSRGPNHCARLELTVRTGGAPTKIIVVSDGIGLAHACGLQGKAAQVETSRFLAPDDTPLPDADIERVLRVNGCGGPYQLLKAVQVAVEVLTVMPGTWKNRQVYRLSGRVKSTGKPAAEVPASATARTCHLYLDAATLWPLRVEWVAADSTDPVLQVEFRDAELNRALTDEECAREFTFVPE